jgi:hypothetical protein
MVLVVLFFALIGLPQLRKLWSAQAAPQPQRKATNPDTPNTNGKVPGNPGNTAQDLLKLDDVLRTYKTRHQGKLPPDATQLVMDVRTHTKEYPYSVDEFFNSDSARADAPAARENSQNYFPYIVSNRRPDGTFVGSKKRPGTRDILAITELYYHRNFRISKSGSTMSPVGFFLVLWEDGKVERVPFDLRVFIPAGDRRFVHAIKGQAGVPENAIPYKTFYRHVTFVGSDRDP